MQTPDIRYREFAGARDVSDAVIASQAEVGQPVLNPPARGDVHLEEEHPQHPSPDQSQPAVHVESAAGGAAAPSQYHLARGEAAAAPDTVSREPVIIAPTPTLPTRPDPGVLPPGVSPYAPSASAAEAPPLRPAPPPPLQTAPPPSPPMHPAPPLPVEEMPSSAVASPSPGETSPPSPRPAAAAGRGLLGGAYRGNGDSSAVVPNEPRKGGGARALDSVFSRLAGSGAEPREPHDRMSHSPESDPTTDQPC